jgi:hypothetical protein
MDDWLKWRIYVWANGELASDDPASWDVSPAPFAGLKGGATRPAPWRRDRRLQP